MTNKYIATFLLLIFLISCSQDKSGDQINTQDLTEVTKTRMRDSIERVLTNLGSLNDPKIVLPYYAAKYKIDTLNIKYILEYVEILSISEKTQQAFSLLNQTLKWSDQKAKLYESKGKVWQSVAAYQVQKKLDSKFAIDSSLFYIEKASLTDPTNVSFLINLSSIHRFLKKYDLALEDIEKAIKIQPTNRTHYLFRGAIKLELDDYKGAYDDLTPITDIRRMDYSWYLQRGVAAARLEKFDLAIKDLDTCEMLKYNSPDLYYLRGKFKTHFKELKRAGFLELKKAIELGYPVPEKEKVLIEKKLSEYAI